MIRYKFEVMPALKDAGYNSYRIQKEKLLSSTTVQKLRHGDTTLTIENLNAICDMLECQPGDILEWYPAEQRRENP